MKQLKVAVSAGLEDVFESVREQVPVKGADWMEVSAVETARESVHFGVLQNFEENGISLDRVFLG